MSEVVDDVDEVDERDPVPAGKDLKDLDVLFDTLDSLGATMESMLDRVEALETVNGPAPAEERTVQESAAAPAAVAQLSDALVAWVEWLIGRYGLATRFPKNWTEVPGVVEEMDALHAAWVYCFDAETGAAAPGFEATQWHDALQRVLIRIQDVWRREHSAGRRG